MKHNRKEVLVDRGRRGLIKRFSCTNRGCKKRNKPGFVRDLSLECKGIPAEKRPQFGAREQRILDTPCSV